MVRLAQARDTLRGSGRDAIRLAAVLTFTETEAKKVFCRATNRFSKAGALRLTPALAALLLIFSCSLPLAAQVVGPQGSDDNVHIQNTMQLAQALQAADKDFEMMVYPRSRHGVGGAHVQRLQLEFMERALGLPVTPREPRPADRAGPAVDNDGPRGREEGSAASALSGSMSNKIGKARDAVVEFFKTANPQDEFFMVTFADKPELVADFTQSVEDIQGKLIYTIPKGRTALLDGIYMALTKMRDAKHNKKALLIISDGGDNRSRYTDSEIKAMVKEADVQIYAIGIFDDVRPTPEEVRGPYLLGEITDVTGGRTFPVNDVNDLADTAIKIGVELRNQYVLGYRPSNKTRDGKWRKVKIRLNAPKGLPPLNVHAKMGYYAPQK